MRILNDYSFVTNNVFFSFRDNIIVEIMVVFFYYVSRLICFAEALEEQSEHDELPFIKKVKRFYRSCMDESTNFIFLRFQYRNI